MSREKSKQPKLRGESTEAEHWGGPTHRSDEGPVMGLEQRGRVRQLHRCITETTGDRMNSMHATNKPFNIEKRLVYEAYKAIKSNGKAAGVDGQTLEQFEADLWWVGTGLEVNLLCPSPLAEPVEQISRNGLPRLHARESRHTVG